MGEARNPAREPQRPSTAKAGRVDGRPTQSVARRIALFVFGRLAGALLRLLGATWRVEVLGNDPRDAQSPDSPERAHLAALFHESMLPCAWLYRDRGYGVAVSRSRDGDLVRSALIALGYAEPPRGSSSRGGSAALRGLLRGLEVGKTGAVLVDGPRGPARIAKTGIIPLARMADSPIQPVAFAARPAVRLTSWDRSLVPLPFARVVCAYGDPIEIDPAARPDDALEQAMARRLDKKLVALHQSADRLLR
ncbi:MAG: hypothetical protein CL908_04190 [Deltaproteobacteria bacterium]|nr:hypothetical protein [Deltaproteobacteria bacterium]